MLLRLLPPDLLGLLVVSSVLTPSFILASPAVNVALQASFDAPPYILELLLVTMTSYFIQDNAADTILERQLQKKMRPLTSHSSTV